MMEFVFFEILQMTTSSLPPFFPRLFVRRSNQGLALIYRVDVDAR